MANPIGQIRAAALMLEFLGSVHKDSNCMQASIAIEKAIQRNLNEDKAIERPIEVGGRAKTMEVAQRLAGLVAG